MEPLRICSIIFLVIICSGIVQSMPPELPNILYGKIIDAQGNPVNNAIVQVSWTDINDISQTRSLRSEGIIKDKIGYYSINDIYAKEGSEIKIECYGKEISVNANPGNPIKVQDLVVDPENNIIKSIGESIRSTISYFIPEYNEKNDSEIKEYNQSNPQDSSENESLNSSIENNDPINKSDMDTIKNREIISNNGSINASENKDNLQQFSPIITKLPSEVFVCEDQILSLYFEVYHPEEGEINLRINPGENISPFNIAEIKHISNENWNYNLFSRKINKEDSKDLEKGYKVYNEQIVVDDSKYIDIKNITITAIEVNHEPILKEINTRTAELQNKNNHIDIDVSDPEYQGENIIFNVSSDLSYRINNNSIKLELSKEDLGIHKMTVCANDIPVKNPHKNISMCESNKSPRYPCTSFNITVTEYDKSPLISSYYPFDIPVENKNKEIIFNITGYDPDNTIPDVYWYLNKELVKFSKSVSLDSYIINYCSITGPINLSVIVTDGLLNSSYRWDFNPNRSACLMKNIQNKSKSYNIDWVVVVSLIIVIIILLIVVVRLLLNNRSFNERMEKIREQKKNIFRDMRIFV